MIPRLRPQVTAADVLAAGVGASSVIEFEQAFARLMGQRDAIAFPYGRTGLMLLLEALQLKGKEIICPAYTCVVVAHAIVMSGNRPVFIDNAPDGFNMDLDLAEAAIGADTGAIVATSIHGYPVDLDRLDELKRRNPGVVIIQDCAHSFAAEFNGRPVQKEGIAAVFGLNISKLITSIFGGMVSTDDVELARSLRVLRDQQLTPPGILRGLSRTAYLAAATIALNPTVFGVVDWIRRRGLIDRFTVYYDPAQIDMPSDYLIAMCQAEASVGIRQIGCYQEIIAHRRRLAEVYSVELAGCEAIVRPPLVRGATYSHYVLQTPQAVALCKGMASAGVELGRVIDYCVPDMPAYRDYVREGQDFPFARRLSQEVINLPMHVSEEEGRRVAKTLVKVMKGLAS